MLTPRPIRVFLNPHRGISGLVVLPTAGFRRARAEISSWPDYGQTPLLDLPVWAASAGVAMIRMKDESGRFGLGSFKALGGAYAVANLLSDHLSRNGIAAAAGSADLVAGRYRDATELVTVTCATDGNHGRSVAWGANRFHCRCVIFVHETVNSARVLAIKAFGADVRRVPGTYDDAVREAARQAAQNGWYVASDTSWPGYTEVPRDIMQGYRVMADEAADQWIGPPPTHIFIQAGVGGVAAAVSVHARLRFDPTPMLVVVEPSKAACLLVSAENDVSTAIQGDLDTVMAGLACGEPSLLAWEELRRSTMAFVAISDESALETVQLLAERNIVAGESGVAGLAGCMLAGGDNRIRAALHMDQSSRVLVFNTEGATGA